MPQWTPIVGLSFDAAGFDIYCKGLSWAKWRPGFIALHNTAVPDLAGRPKGFTAQHIQNLVHYYRDEKGWSAGPHLFVDDHRIWVFTPLTKPGVHSPSWNHNAIGLEMLGDYRTDAFDSGRGAEVRKNAVRAMASLSGALGIDPGTMMLHKEDGASTHRGCPGDNVSKAGVIAEVKAALADRFAFEHQPDDPHPD